MKKKLFLIFIIAFFVIINIICSACNEKYTAKGKEDVKDALYKNPNISIEKRIEDLMSRMTLEEKIGQMTQVDRSFLMEDIDIAKYNLGSVLCGGGSGPELFKNPKTWKKIADKYQSISLQTRLEIPLLYGVDAVHGHALVRGTVVFPHNIGMGCTGNPGLVEEAARITAIEVTATGFNWNFAPSISVVQNERWGRTYEGFSEHPDIVKMMSAASVRGFQGSRLNDNTTILACAKHFIGDGGTLAGLDRGDTQVDENTLKKIHLPGYLTAINEGVGTIMASHSSWNGTKMHGHKYLLTDFLKNELGFDGFIVSDWGSINDIPGTYRTQVTTAINAGIDMNMVPDNYLKFTKTLKELVNQNLIKESRIDDAVRRILKIKFKMGLFENRFTDENLIELIGSEKHRKVARQCVRESAVLLKNDNNILPLSKKLKKIHIVGENADDIGYQCGGWTIEWQGDEGNITKGTTILKGIKETVSKKTKITHSEDGSGAKGADVCIVVIAESEKPYAEWFGDAQKLGIHYKDMKALKEVKKSGVPTIVILITGRPTIITDYINDWDALLVAWLPGTEGNGISDVLFGDYNPTGKLSYSWPKDMSQIPINYYDEKYDPLFPYGFGLSY